MSAGARPLMYGFAASGLALCVEYRSIRRIVALLALIAGMYVRVNANSPCSHALGSEGPAECYLA